MKFKCPYCRKELEVKYEVICPDITLKFVLFFVICHKCKGRVRLIFEVDEDSKKPKNIRTDIISSMDYIG